MGLTDDQKAAFARDGFVMAPRCFSADAMASALDACDRIFYGGKRFAQWRDAYGGSAGAVRDGFFTDDAAGRSQFPVGVDALDSLIADAGFLDAFADCLGTDAMHYCNAHLFVRSGPTDTRHAPNPWEGYHFDHDTNSFLPPTGRVGTDDYVNCWVFLHDVGPDDAPMRLIPGSHRQVSDLLPDLIARGDFRPPGSFPDIRRVPEFAPSVAATATAGTALFYSSWLVHAAVPFADKGAQRAVWTLSMARAETRAVNRFANAYAYADRSFTKAFWTTASARVRSLFGWPPPGDPIYTETTLGLLEAWYPGMDLGEYR